MFRFCVRKNILFDIFVFFLFFSISHFRSLCVICINFVVVLLVHLHLCGDAKMLFDYLFAVIITVGTIEVRMYLSNIIFGPICSILS